MRHEQEKAAEANNNQRELDGGATGSAADDVVEGGKRGEAKEGPARRPGDDQIDDLTRGPIRMHASIINTEINVSPADVMVWLRMNVHALACLAITIIVALVSADLQYALLCGLVVVGIGLLIEMRNIKSLVTATLFEVVRARYLLLLAGNRDPTASPEVHITINVRQM